MLWLGGLVTEFGVVESFAGDFIVTAYIDTPVEQYRICIQVIQVIQVILSTQLNHTNAKPYHVHRHPP
jgi:hypothetical protein